MSDQRNPRDDAAGGPASPRTTIVGGQPTEGQAARPAIPVGIQQLLHLASVDAEFRRQLIAQRAAAAPAAGIELRPSEAAILAAVPAAQLGQMAASMPPPGPSRRELLRRTAATAAVLLGGAALGEAAAACGSKQPEPGLPPPGPPPGVPPAPPPTWDAGSPQQILKSAGVRPDLVPPPEPAPPVAGIRPDPVPPLAVDAGISPVPPERISPKAGIAPRPWPGDPEPRR